MGHFEKMVTLEISESSLEDKCSNSVTRNFVSSKQSDIFGKESKNVSNVDLCKVPKSKLHLTKVIKEKWGQYFANNHFCTHLCSKKKWQFRNKTFF